MAYKEIQTYEIPLTFNDTGHESDTIDMYDNDRYTDDFTDREVKDDIYL